MRLIDADALWMDIIHSMDYCDDILGIIEQQPTIEERKTGKWEDNNNIWMCNKCGKWIDILQGDADMNFCPNCGARMEGTE